MSNWTEANWNTGQFTSVPTTAPTPPPSPSTGRGGGKGGFGGGGGRGGHCQIQMGLKDSTGYSSYFVYTYAIGCEQTSTHCACEPRDLGLEANQCLVTVRYANNEAAWMKDFAVGFGI